MSPSTSPRVFISYSHDSTEHEARVLSFANRLREYGVDAIIDQYSPAPPRGWPLWMDLEIQRATFVLLVCTGTYLCRVEHREEPGMGRGVMWESALIYNHLYLAEPPVQEFIPILFADSSPADIPMPLRTMTYYFVETEEGYEDLYRHLTAQPRNQVPSLGKLRTLPYKRVQSYQVSLPDSRMSSAEAFMPLSVETEARSGMPGNRLNTTLSPHNLPPRNPHFVGRTSELRSIHTSLNRHLSSGVSRQVGIRGHGGLGKTSIAIEYGWTYLTYYPGGIFVIDCSSDYKKKIAELAGFLGIRDADPQDLDRTVPLVINRLSSDPRSLIILDNVRDSDQWTSEVFRGCIPTGECRRLITTRSRHLPDVEMSLAERLPTSKGAQLLAKRRPDASAKNNRPVVANIVESLDGFALGLTLIGMYMHRAPHVSWQSYAVSLADRGLGALVSTEKIVGKLGDYNQGLEAVFADLLNTLDPMERRALEYATILPQEGTDPAWMKGLLNRDGDLPAVRVPGYGLPSDAVLANLQAEQLLAQRDDVVGMLTLHPLVRQSLRELLIATEGAFNTLVQRVLTFAEEESSISLGRRVGRVKWFNSQKGFGFLSVRDGKDVFVHISAVERAGLRTLVDGDLMFFELANERGKSAAVNIAKVIDPRLDVDG